MIEAGAPSTGGWVVPAPPGIVMVASPEVPRNAEKAPKRRAAPKRLRKAARRGPGLVWPTEEFPGP